LQIVLPLSEEGAPLGPPIDLTVQLLKRERCIIQM